LGSLVELRTGIWTTRSGLDDVSSMTGAMAVGSLPSTMAATIIEFSSIIPYSMPRLAGLTARDVDSIGLRTSPRLIEKFQL
jgi:hypothetical protein